MKRLTYCERGKWRIKLGNTEYRGESVDQIAAVEDVLGEEYELEEIKKVIQCKDCEHMWAVSALPGKCYCRLRGEVVPKDGYCHRGRAALKAREPDA